MERRVPGTQLLRGSIIGLCQIHGMSSTTVRQLAHGLPSIITKGLLMQSCQSLCRHELHQRDCLLLTEDTVTRLAKFWVLYKRCGA